jgi:exosome complex exonuclease DIS3/RRP44
VVMQRRQNTNSICLFIRYADVCVHRLLAAAIGLAPLPQHLSSKSYLHDLCANMNRRHRAAQLAGRASVQLHTLIFFAGDGAKEEEAYVLDVETGDGSEPSFTVMVPRYGIEGRVKLSISADDPNLVRSPEEHRLTYKQGTTTTTLQVLDKVKVLIWVREVQDHQRELVLDLVEPTFGAPEPARKHSRDVAKTAGATSSRPKRRKAK